MKRFRLTGIVSPENNLHSELAIEKMKSLNLIGNITIKRTQPQQFIDVVNCTAEDIKFNDINFKVNYNPKRLDLFVNVKDDLDSSTIKEIFLKMQNAKQFNRYAIEIVELVSDNALLEVLTQQLGELKQFHVNLSNGDREMVGTSLCSIIKKIENENRDLRKIIEINNIPDIEGQNSKKFIDSIEDVIKRVKLEL